MNTFFLSKKSFCQGLALALLSSSAYCYEVGDTISDDIGKKLSLPEGKVAIIDFFASWCVSCEKEIPEMHTFIKMDTTHKTQVIGVDVDENLEDGLGFQKKLNIQFPVINDQSQELIEAFAPIGMPAMYFVINNKIVGKRIGAVNHIDEKIRLDLEKLGIKI